MQAVWTEEFASVVVANSASTERLGARIVVTGVGAIPVHIEVVLTGELCSATTPTLAAIMARLLPVATVDVRFDLVGLSLCTSDGIDLWVDIATRLRRNGGDLRLDGAVGVVRRALDAVGVSDSGTVLPTEADHPGRPPARSFPRRRGMGGRDRG